MTRKRRQPRLRKNFDRMRKSGIRLKSPDDIKRIRESGIILSELFSLISRMDLDGITTWDIDSFADDFIMKRKGRAAFKTITDYNYASCISINSEAVHGIPSRKRKVQQGDLVKIDSGVALNGYFSDACHTFPVGKASPEAEKLVASCRKALMAGIGFALAGFTTGDMGYAVSESASDDDFSIVKKLAAHGTGFSLHEPPRIPHYGARGGGLILMEGLVFTLEPIMNAGKPDVVKSENRYTLVSADGSLSAQFEHTIAITGEGPVILTA